MTLDCWLSISTLASSIATAIASIAAIVISTLLLRKIEGIKIAVAGKSEFHKRWAEQFFDCCQNFMQAVEKELALLTILSSSKDKNGELGAEWQKEASCILPIISELELRIRRSIVFAPQTGDTVTAAASKCTAQLSKLISSGQGSVDPIISEMNAFNVASHEAHAEMLNLNTIRSGK